LDCWPKSDSNSALSLEALFRLFFFPADRAREWIARALALEPDNPVTHYNAACGYAMLADIDKFFELLESGVLMGGPEWGRWVRHGSMLDPFRDDPRYQALLETIRQREIER
jgi:adenylate cyclase